jgi:hypothetical protein
MCIYNDRTTPIHGRKHKQQNMRDVEDVVEQQQLHKQQIIED